MSAPLARACRGAQAVGACAPCARTRARSARRVRRASLMLPRVQKLDVLWVNPAGAGCIHSRIGEPTALALGAGPDASLAPVDVAASAHRSDARCWRAPTTSGLLATCAAHRLMGSSWAPQKKKRALALHCVSTLVVGPTRNRSCCIGIRHSTTSSSLGERAMLLPSMFSHDHEVQT